MSTNAPAPLLPPESHPASARATGASYLDRLPSLIDESVRVYADRNDELARFPEEGIRALGEEGLLGLSIPTALGGLGQGPGLFAKVVAALAEADASLAMVYLMHLAGAAVLLQASQTSVVSAALREMAMGRHLTTLAFSEKGSRSHFWSPVSRARRTPEGVRLSANKSWVTSAGHAQSMVVTTLSAEGHGPVDTTLYLLRSDEPGVLIGPAWNGMGLRGNASSPIELKDCCVPEEARLSGEGGGMSVKLQTVLPLFNLGVAAMDLGISRAAVKATVAHLTSARLEHMGSSLAEAFPTLRAQVARMQSATDGLELRVEDLVRQLESPGPQTLLRVLETKAAANEIAIQVTSDAMRACGGAAFSRHTRIDRYFRDAQAGAVMAPTVDQVNEFVGRAVLGLPLM
ncbi:MAG: acyl-CoA/acyl-ACP dehydrogenase [Thermoplasmata archaeon]|nr:acyl-CoA/acyl-ACP dehydrogenase [Thermoplasmata archaeon]